MNTYSVRVCAWYSTVSVESLSKWATLKQTTAEVDGAEQRLCYEFDVDADVIQDVFEEAISTFGVHSGDCGIAGPTSMNVKLLTA